MNNTKMPKLNVAQIEDLLCAPYDMVLVYNHADNKINKKSYAGLPVANAHMERVAGLFKQKMEAMPQMQGRKLVASAVHGTPSFCWEGDGKFVKFASVEEESPYVIGNVIVFNEKTAQFESNPAGWYCVNVINTIRDNEYVALRRFLVRMQQLEQERKNLVAPFARQK